MASSWPLGGGAMGEAVRAHDWSATPLGPVEAWPQSLKTLVELMLASRQPAYIGWGPQLISLFNDGYIPIVGEKLAGALGKPYRELWPELREMFEPVIEATLAGEAQHFVDQPVALEGRPGRPLSWFTFSWTPVRDDSGAIAGFFCAATETTEKVEAQTAALRQRDDRHRTLLESMDEGFCVLEMIFDADERPVDYRFVEYNSAFERQTGLTGAQGRTARELVPTLEPHWFETYGRVALTGEPIRFVNHAEPMDRWFSVYAVRIGDPAARQVALIFTDVTQSKVAEAALRESEARFRHMADALPQIVWITDADGRTEFFNRQWYDYTGADRLETTAAEIAEQHLHPEDVEATMIRFNTARATGSTYEVEHRIRGRNGEHRWFLVRGEPYRDPASGQIVRWFGSSTDIHDRRQTEAALRESEEDFRQAAALNPQVAWTAQANGELDRVAPRWMEWTGTTGLGSSYAEGLHSDDVPRTFEVWGRSVATGEPYDVVHRVKRLSGEFRWIRSRAYARRDESGRIIRWYGTTEDIHEQKLAEDHLKLMVLELNHRVKNNLATVQAIAVQTLRGTERPEQAREAFLQRISALAAAHDILTREQWDGVGIGEVAHGVLDALTGALDRVTISGPPVRLSPKVALALSMAFHELGTNALKYGALSGPNGQVDLEWSIDPPTGGLEVSWTERGGPRVEPPARRGFGSRLLERGLAAELRGKVTLDFRPEGLKSVIKAAAPTLESAG